MVLVLAGAKIVYLTQSSLMQLSVALVYTLGRTRNLIPARCSGYISMWMISK